MSDRWDVEPFNNEVIELRVDGHSFTINRHEIPDMIERLKEVA